MPDASAGTVAFLNGGEVVNDARTIAYLENGFGPGSITINGGCVCPNIRELIDCGSAPYKSPALDPAPWYNASIPESADFAGFLSHDFTGLGSTFTRTKTDKITGGSILGPLRPQARTLVWKGYLFGKSECAVQYGLRWLTANLIGTGCDCGGEDLDILICCPDLVATPPVSGCDNTLIHKPLNCPPFDQPDAFRTIKNVGLIDGPKILSQRKVGCCSTGCASCGGASLIIEVEFSLLCGNPYLYGCEVCLGANQTFPTADVTNCQWLKVMDATQTITAMSNVGITVTATIADTTDMIVGEAIAISGATGLTNVNGSWTIQSILSGTTFTFMVITTPTGSYSASSATVTFQPSDCGTPVCPPPTDCTVDPFCSTGTLPPAPTFTDKCFCDPIVPTEICFTIPADAVALFESVPVIEIFSGSAPMRATTIRFFQNPKDLPCCTIGEEPCFNCASMQIRYIPANSTMVIDGTTKQVTIQCPGATVPEIGDHLVGIFTWPILECIDYCVCVETEGMALASDATVSLLIVPREM